MSDGRWCSVSKQTAGDLPGQFRPADRDEADRRAVVARQGDALLREQLGAQLDAFTVSMETSAVAAS